MVLVGGFFDVDVPIRIRKEIFCCLSLNDVALTTLCQEATLEDPLTLCSSPVISVTYSESQSKLHANLLKSLAKILGIFVASYNCPLSSVWEAGPFISAPLHLSFNLVVHTVYSS